MGIIIKCHKIKKNGVIFLSSSVFILLTTCRWKLVSILIRNQKKIKYWCRKKHVIENQTNQLVFVINQPYSCWKSEKGQYAFIV